MEPGEEVVVRGQVMESGVEIMPGEKELKICFKNRKDCPTKISIIL